MLATGTQRVARATHNIYAYRIMSGGDVIEHYEDDGKYGAGRRLLDLLRDNEISDRMICVTRWYDGSHLGPVRFNHILDAGKRVLQLQAIHN